MGRSSLYDFDGRLGVDEELDETDLDYLLTEIQLLQSELANPSVVGKDGKKLSKFNYRQWRFRKIGELHSRLAEYRKLKRVLGRKEKT